MTLIDAPTVLEDLHTIIGRVGHDHSIGVNDRTQGCIYFAYPDEYAAEIAPGAPSCIVGHILDLHSISIPWESNDSRVNGGFFEQVFTFEALKILETAQDIQDQGQTWGQAFDAVEQGEI